MPSPDPALPVLVAQMDPERGVFVIDQQNGQPLSQGSRTWLWATLLVEGVTAQLVDGGIRISLDDWQIVDDTLQGLAELVIEVPWTDEGELRARPQSPSDPLVVSARRSAGRT